MANTKSTTKKSTTKKVEATKKTTAAKTAKATKKPAVKKVEVKEAPIKKEVKEVEVKKEIVKEKVKKGNFFKENTTNILIGALCLLLIVNIVLVALGHKVTLKDGNQVIASVKGKKYTAEDLFDDLKVKYGSTALINMIDSYITEKELTKDEISEAKSTAQEYIDSVRTQYEQAGYDWETILSNYGYETEEDLLNEYLVSVKSEMLVKKEIKKSITDEDIQKYYDENVYGTYTIKHILVMPETTSEMTEEEVTAAEEAAKAKVQEAIDRYANGESWADLVNEYSEDTGSKENEGLVENFTKGDLDEAVFNATLSLKDGEYTKEPVKSSYGYHAVLRVSSTEKDSLENKKEEIISALVDEKLNSDEKLYNNTLISIRKNYKLNIKDTKIKSLYEKSIAE